MARALGEISTRGAGTSESFGAAGVARGSAGGIASSSVGVGVGAGSADCLRGRRFGASAWRRCGVDLRDRRFARRAAPVVGRSRGRPLIDARVRVFRGAGGAGVRDRGADLVRSGLVDAGACWLRADGRASTRERLRCGRGAGRGHRCAGGCRRRRWARCGHRWAGPIARGTRRWIRCGVAVVVARGAVRCASRRGCQRRRGRSCRGELDTRWRWRWRRWWWSGLDDLPALGCRLRAIDVARCRAHHRRMRSGIGRDSRQKSHRNPISSFRKRDRRVTGRAVAAPGAARGSRPRSSDSAKRACAPRRRARSPTRA